MHPLSLNRRHDFSHGSNRHVLWRAPQPQDALNAVLHRCVPEPTRAVLNGLDTLHIRECHRSVVDVDGGVEHHGAKSRDRASPRCTVWSVKLFRGFDSYQVVPPPLLVTVRPDEL